MIRVERLSKMFGAVQALSEVSFEARDGRITGLLGHNGAGKSTTLRILSTVLRPDTGQAIVDGHDCVAAPLRVRSSLGVLPAACISSTSGVEMRPSGRTGTSMLRSG